MVSKWYIREWNAFKDGLLGIAAILAVALVLALAFLFVFSLVAAPMTSIGAACLVFVLVLIFAPRRET